MINYLVLKREAVSQRVLELSCSQANSRRTEFLTTADPLLASLIVQPISECGIPDVAKDIRKTRHNVDIKLT